jgi:hypothetical protein
MILEEEYQVSYILYIVMFIYLGLIKKFNLLLLNRVAKFEFIGSVVSGSLFSR